MECSAKNPGVTLRIGDGLRAVLTELCDVPLVLLRPRAPGAVEAVLLVDLQERLDAALNAHLLVRDLQRVQHCGHTDRDLLAAGDVDLGLVDVCFRGLRRHAFMLRLATRRSLSV